MSNPTPVETPSGGHYECPDPLIHSFQSLKDAFGVLKRTIVEGGDVQEEVARFETLLAACEEDATKFSDLNGSVFSQNRYRVAAMDLTMVSQEDIASVGGDSGAEGALEGKRFSVSSRRASERGPGSCRRATKTGLKFSPRENVDVEVGSWINTTYSQASFGSWRKGSPEAGSKRVQYLSFCLEGMPALDIENPMDMRARFSRKTTRHTEVLQTGSNTASLLDECDVPPIHDINSAEFNIFHEYTSHGSAAFTVVAMNVLLRYSFVSSLRLDVQKLFGFVKAVQDHYRSDNPYHNALHAADVLQTTHLYLLQKDVKENFSDIELLATLVAAMCLDVGHLGVNNDFLVKSQHPLAVLYGDHSVQEMASAALTFTILSQEDFDFFNYEVVEANEWRDFRYLVLEIILGTDSTHHAQHIMVTNRIIQMGRVTDEDVPKLLQAIVHAADISYGTKPHNIFLEWVRRASAEAWRQGDAEGVRDLAKSAMCDRELGMIGKSQVGFLQYVLEPLMSELGPIVPAVWSDRIQFNADSIDFNTFDSTHIEAVSAMANEPWADIPAESNKNFLVILRRWINTEVPPPAPSAPSSPKRYRASKVWLDEPVLPKTPPAKDIVRVGQPDANARALQHLFILTKAFQVHSLSCFGASSRRSDSTVVEDFANKWISLLFDLQKSSEGVPPLVEGQTIHIDRPETFVDVLMSLRDAPTPHPASLLGEDGNRNAAAGVVVLLTQTWFSILQEAREASSLASSGVNASPTRMGVPSTYQKRPNSRSPVSSPQSSPQRSVKSASSPDLKNARSQSQRTPPRSPAPASAPSQPEVGGAETTEQPTPVPPPAPAPAPAATPSEEEVPPPNTIWFYKDKEKYGCFTNFYPSPFKFGEHVWPTSEHAFQAQKFYGSEKDMNDVLNAPTPKDSAKIGRDRSRPLRKDWEEVKDNLMYEILLAKFQQHADLREELLSTGDMVIVEHTTRDNYWGDGGDSLGKNMLGKTLMRVREEFRKGQPSK